MKIFQTLTVVVVLSLMFMGATTSFAQRSSSTDFLPPPMGFPPPPATSCTDGKFLYVTIGPKIFQYSIPELTLQNSVDLPRPTPPAGK